MDCFCFTLMTRSWQRWIVLQRSSPSWPSKLWCRSCSNVYTASSICCIKKMDICLRLGFTTHILPRFSPHIIFMHLLEIRQLFWSRSFCVYKVSECMISSPWIHGNKWTDKLLFKKDNRFHNRLTSVNPYCHKGAHFTTQKGWINIILIIHNSSLVLFLHSLCSDIMHLCSKTVFYIKC